VTKLITQVPAASFNDKFSVFLSSIALHHYGMWNIHQKWCEELKIALCHVVSYTGVMIFYTQIGFSF